ncbi:NAD(P)H-quinone oxidoreductase subunit M, chloroplastic [Silene latifolia]|uniref:NAD(P)H-quinone oxidoreductase subunit M, chloroplastic n=1 Tax=Silene latifolia TaxID=37657 RepID=UPI003D76CDE9
MAGASSYYIASTNLPIASWKSNGTKRAQFKSLGFRISAQQAEVKESEQGKTVGEDEQQTIKQKVLQPVEPQINVQNRNMGREYGGQWLSSVTRHVRIYAAYIDPETCAMDQTQMDKLTLILDPGEEFLWTDETCNKVYSYYQELVDHYEGAPLTEYTLRLIGSDIEHYIRKMLYDGEIKYNMNCRVLNFSMGKPRMKFNSSEIENVQE